MFYTNRKILYIFCILVIIYKHKYIRGQYKNLIMSNKWIQAMNCYDKLEVGDDVEIKYNEHSGGKDEEPGELVKDTGTITKMIDSLGGGVYLQMNRGVHSGNQNFKLHNVKGGTITGTNPFGSRTVRIGVNAKLRKDN